jgi:hypothetical protein
MATDPLALVRGQIGQRIAEIHQGGARLSPLDLHARMDAIRQMAADHGMVALERLARNSAQRALLPGHRVAMRSCLAHIDDALDSRSVGDSTTILAALAVRLN